MSKLLKHIDRQYTSLFIARRLSLKRDTAEQDSYRRSPAVIIAVAGIALSMSIMLLTLAIVPGFKNQITKKVMGFDAQVTMQPVQPSDNSGNYMPVPVTFTTQLDSIISSKLPAEAHASIVVRQPGILKTDTQFAGIVFKTIDEYTANTFLADNIESGTIPDLHSDSTKYHIVISRTTATELNLSTGDKINAYFFIAGNMLTRRFTISGIYNSHFNEYDKLLSFIPLETARSISKIDDTQGSSIEIRGLQPDDIPLTRYKLQQAASEAFYSNATNCYLSVNDVYELNPMYFNWLDLLNTNVIVILALMAAVAAVTLISCLFILILERVQFIGTLKALGATDGLISSTFIFMTERIVLRGILTGNIIGLTLIWLQWQFKFIPLDPEAYYLNAVPVEFKWSSFILLNVVSVILSLAVMLIPTRTISRLSPSKVMRFE